MRLIDIYNRPFSKGILFSLSKDLRFRELFALLNLSTEDEVHSLDVDYIFNMSGLKTSSVLLEMLLNEYVIDDNDNFVIDRCGRKITYDKFLDELDQRIIDNIIAVRYSQKWIELAKTLSIDYDVANPYNMQVTDSLNINTSGEFSSGRKQSGSDNNSSQLEQDNRMDRDIQGFNSIDYNPSDRNTERNTSKGSDNRTYSGSVEDSGNNSRTTNNARSITRKGNIGNRSVTELIDERRSMLRYQIVTEIYKDLDSVLTRSKYI